MAAELFADDLRFMREDGEAAEPFHANVVVALLENEALPVGAVIEIREMKEEAHVKGLPDRTKAPHERVVQTREVSS